MTLGEVVVGTVCAAGAALIVACALIDGETGDWRWREAPPEPFRWTDANRWEK